MSQTQRTVSNTLGRNNTHNHETIYNEIEHKIGKIQICNFGHIRGSITGVKHEGDPNVPIREFELKLDKNGWGLQGFCKICSKRRRRKRLEMSREQNKGGYDTYEKNYGIKTKYCSSCKEDKDVREHFNVSPGMECGIHNICIACSKIYGESMGDRLIKYRPDGTFKYKKTEKGQHDDHIMPLAYGGTNEEINHQLLLAKENLKKSDTIPYDNVIDISPMQLSERWRPILYQAQQENVSIVIFKSRICFAILEEQIHIYSMTDEEIEKVYCQYNIDNNRRVNTNRCVEKFKNYCKDILKLDKSIVITNTIDSMAAAVE